MSNQLRTAVFRVSDHGHDKALTEASMKEVKAMYDKLGYATASTWSQQYAEYMLMSKRVKHGHVSIDVKV